MHTVVIVAVIGAAWLLLAIACGLLLGRAVRYRDAGQPVPPPEAVAEDEDDEDVENLPALPIPSQRVKSPVADEHLFFT